MRRLLAVLPSRITRSKVLPIWLFGVVAAALVLAGLHAMPNTRARLQTIVFDSYQQIRPRAWGGSPVTIVDIDETSLARIGQWPWPRDTMAQITDRLMNLGAAAVVFDIVFAEPDRTSPSVAMERLRRAGAQISFDGAPPVLDNDRVFAEAIGRGNVVTAMVMAPDGLRKPPPPKAGIAGGGTAAADILPDNPRAVPNLPEIGEAAAGTGIITIAPDGDGVVRQQPLLWASDGDIHPALSLEALRVAQGASTLISNASDASGEGGGGEPVLVNVRVGDFTVPLGADGRFRVHYSRSQEKPSVPMHVLFEERLDPSVEQLIAGRIILVGTSAQALEDLRTTPLEAFAPGVTVHADIIDQIMTGRFLTRPNWAIGVEYLAAALLPLLVIAVIPYFTPTAHALWAALLIAALAGLSWLGFLYQGLLLSSLLPTATIFAGYAGGSAARLLVTERDERFVREAFGLYLAPAMVDRLASEPDQLKLGGEERELTLLFCDIRGFTALSEGLDPVELTSLLNDFLTPMTRALMERGATIDKYMGDAIMAFWNAPVAQADHRAQAAHAVLDMREALAGLNAELEATRGRRIDIGVGLNTGPCCVGNLGSDQRFNYSAIGDAVNVASRVEGLTKQYGLFNLVAAETIAGAENLAHIEIDRVAVVGRFEPLVVHTLLGRDPEPWAALAERHAVFLDAYRGTDMRAARAALEWTREVAPDDLAKLYDLYAARIATFEAEGLPPDWDGVFRATKK